MSPKLISSVTDAVNDEVKAWQARLLDPVYPKTTVQLCVVRMVRHGLNYVSWKKRPEVAADLKLISTTTTADEAEQHPGECEAKWDDECLPIG